MDAQDLIERTQMGLPAPLTEEPSTMARKLSLKSKFDRVTPFTFDQEKSNSSYTSNSYGQVYLNLDPSVLKSFKKKSQKQLSIPVSTDRAFELLLYPVEVYAAGSTIYDEKGQTIDVERSTFYRGIISDDDSSIASVTVNPKGIRIVISDSQGNYNIGLTNDKSSYVLYNDVNLGAFPFECQNEELGIYNVNNPKKEKKYTVHKDGSDNCVKVYIETDFTTYNNFSGDLQQVVNFVEGTFNEVSTLYSNIQVSMQLSDIKVWTNQDPYGAESSVATALNYISNNVGSFNGDLFHLVSAIGNCCSWSGVGYVSSGDTPGLFNGSTVCGPNPYAVSQTTLYYNSLPNYSWSVNVLAHEMGHNMGAPHTHECAWGANHDTPIDGCVKPSGCADPGLPNQGEGTIMSYCHINNNVGINLANGFHTEVGAHIKAEYDDRTCLTTCGPIEGCTDPNSHGYNPLANTEDGTCIGTCSDGIQNGDETGVDCGGSLCAPCDFECDENYIRLSFTFDQYPAETSWDIKDEQGNVIATSPNYSDKKEDDTENIDLCLPNGTYTFTIYDSYGDGMCCSYGNGSYKMFSAGELIAIGGSFGTSESTTITLSTSAPTCDDGMQNGDEEGIDCGGSYCQPCDESIVCDDALVLTTSWVIGFEEELNSWYQSDDDDIEWERKSGSTTSSNTGPKKAAQEDYYLYVESSNPNFPEKTALLSSPCLLMSALISPSLEFNYHMYGRQMGVLTVSIELLSTGDTIIIMQVSGDQGDQWHSASLPLEEYKNDYVKISIIAESGTGYTSDIAIDELSIMAITPTCTDGVQNGTETGVDCGGGSCTPCFECQELAATISSDEVISGPQEKIVKNKITSNAKVTIEENSSVMWQAGSSIEINGEFEIMPGAEVLLSTEDCISDY